MTLVQQDLRHRLEVGIRAARAGREVLLKYKGRLQKIEKKFQAGLVSEADKEAEAAITKVLLTHFPHDEILGEETAVQGQFVAPAKMIGRWIIDPLDGTTNYIHQFPVFAVSIGWEFAGEVKLGIIDVPMLNEVYTSIRGEGAWVNGSVLKVSSNNQFSEAFLATGFFTENEKLFSEQLKMFEVLAPKVRAVRRAGAAAYDLACVARGVFDGYWEKNLQPWDSAAGLLLVEEAGGKVTTFQGDKYDPYKNSLVAGNPAMVDRIVDSLRTLDKGTA